MKAAVIHQHGGPGTIRIETDFPDPEPGEGDVVIQVGATTLNYHDIFTRRGMPGIKVPMPCIMGLDFAGEIAGLGAGVTDWRVGERVLIDPVDRVGPGGLIGEMWHGGLAEFCKVPAHHLVRLPDAPHVHRASEHVAIRQTPIDLARVTVREEHAHPLKLGVALIEAILNVTPHGALAAIPNGGRLIPGEGQEHPED